MSGYAIASRGSGDEERQPVMRALDFLDVRVITADF
jgi:hypothetical protein